MNRFFSPSRSALLTLACLATLPELHAQSAWNVAGPVGAYTWNDAANWTPATIPNAVGDTALLNNNLANAGTVSINLDIPATLGNLTMGDSTGNNGFFNIFNGTAGSLTFDATGSANATLQKTAGSTTTDNITATVALNDTLAADVRTGTIAIAGAISGTGGILRSGTVSGAVTTAGGTLTLSNNNNSYTGTTVIEHGVLNVILNTDVVVSSNSVLGNSATAIAFGTSTLAPATAGNNTQTLRFNAGADSGNYTVARGLNFAAVTQTGAGSTSVVFQGNGTGAVNTNKLTLSGPIVIGGSRAPSFQVLRGGMTMDITADITGVPTAGTMTFNTFPSAPNADGRGSGTIRFSNLARTYNIGQALNTGMLVIDGNVGAVGTASPIGFAAVALANGGGTGNIVGAGNFAGGGFANDTSADTVRAIFLESAGSSYARTMSPGGGSTSTPGGYTSAVNVINGFQFGGLNTSGTVVFSGAINPGNPSVGASATNPITTAINIALIAQTGGVVEFTGGLTDGTSAANTHTRVTINQFRNNPHIDGTNNAGTTVVSDGNADTFANNGANFTADRLVGSATGGTVVLSTGAGTWDGTTEVLGGTFRVNSSVAGNTFTVAPGATLGGTGTINAGTSGSVLQVNGTLAPGASPGILTSNKPVSLNVGSTFAAEINGTTAGSQYDQLAANSTLSINNTSVFSLTLGYAPTPGEQFTLISLASGSISGTFAGLPEGGIRTATFGGTPYDFSASYVGGNGNDFVLTAVPEPTASVCLMGTVGLLFGSHRRRSAVAV